MKTKLKFFGDELYYQWKSSWGTSWVKCSRGRFLWILFKWTLYGIGCLLVGVIILIALWALLVFVFSL